MKIGGDFKEEVGFANLGPVSRSSHIQRSVVIAIAAVIGAGVTTIGVSSVTIDKILTSQWTVVADTTSNVPNAHRKYAVNVLRAEVSADITGSVVEQRPGGSPIVGWVLHDVFEGRALVGGQNHLYEVGPGSTVPGLGQVKKIGRQNGGWVVVTSGGLITASQ